MQVHFKIKTWVSVDLPDAEGIQEAVKASIEESEITTSSDLIGWLNEKYPEHADSHNYNFHTVDEAEEQITLADNDGFSTIELLNKNGVEWSNGK